MPFPDPSLHYHAYLLRCWAESSTQADDPVWRFSVQDTRTGERRGFASFELLIEFLLRQLQDTSHQEEKE